MYIIETHNLTKFHGNTVRVQNLELRVPEHCVYGFLGPNGAGKTTTLKLLLGLIRPSNGTIRLFGKEVSTRNHLALLQNTGSLIESPAYYGNLTATENLAIIAKLKHTDANDIKEVLHTVRLYEQRDKLVKHYSLGMKQRLGIAMALLGHPHLLILDEPTNGLDPAGIQEMRDFIKNLPQTRDISVVISSHLLSEIEQMADTAGVISHGELVYQGSMNDLKNQGENLEEVFLSLTRGEKEL